MIWNVEPCNLLKLDFSFPIGSVTTHAEDLIKYRYLQSRPFFVRSELVKAANRRSTESLGINYAGYANLSVLHADKIPLTPQMLEATNTKCSQAMVKGKRLRARVQMASSLALHQ